MGCNPACNLSSASSPYTLQASHNSHLPPPYSPLSGVVRDKWTPPPGCGISPTPPTLAGIVRDKADPPGMRDQVIGLFEEWLRLLPTGPDDKV